MYLHNVCVFQNSRILPICVTDSCAAPAGYSPPLSFTLPPILSRWPHCAIPKEPSTLSTQKTAKQSKTRMLTLFNTDMQTAGDPVWYCSVIHFLKMKVKKRNFSLQNSVWHFEWSHDSLQHFKGQWVQFRDGLEEINGKKREASLKWGEENSAARQQTFAKGPPTDVYLLKDEGESTGGTETEQRQNKEGGWRQIMLKTHIQR